MAKAAQINREYLKREPTSVHVGLTEYVAATTGYDVDPMSVQLALSMYGIYRESDENAARLQTEADAREAKKQAVIDKRAGRLSNRQAKLQAKLDEIAAAKAELLGEDAEEEAEVVPIKAAPRPRKTVAAAPSPRRGRPAKVAAPVIDAELPERGTLRQAEDENYDDF